MLFIKTRPYINLMHLSKSTKFQYSLSTFTVINAIFYGFIALWPVGIYFSLEYIETIYSKFKLNGIASNENSKQHILSAAH